MDAFDVRWPDGPPDPPASSSCARSAVRSAASRPWWRCATSTSVYPRDLARDRRAVGVRQVDPAERPRMPRPPTSGTYLFDGIDVGGLTDDERAALRAGGSASCSSRSTCSRTAACSRT